MRFDAPREIRVQEQLCARSLHQRGVGEKDDTVSSSELARLQEASDIRRIKCFFCRPSAHLRLESEATSGGDLCLLAGVHLAQHEGKKALTFELMKQDPTRCQDCIVWMERSRNPHSRSSAICLKP